MQQRGQTAPGLSAPERGNEWVLSEMVFYQKFARLPGNDVRFNKEL